MAVRLSHAAAPRAVKSFLLKHGILAGCGCQPAFPATRLEAGETMASNEAVKETSFGARRRLPCAAAYAYVFKAPQRAGDPHFFILARATKVGHARLGLAVAKKQAKLAVSRNRLKRLIRESFRRQCSELPSADFVVMIRQSAKAQTNKVLCESLEKLWRTQAGRLQTRRVS